MDDADPRQVVQTGYDHMAEQYLARKDPAEPWALAALARLTASLAPGAAVLDLGCGAGVPVAQRLSAHFAVTGVDFSARQIALARTLVPGATFIRADMTAVDFPPAHFAAVVACYSIIHVPRDEQPALLARIHRWLAPGGRFLATWSVGAWEGREENWEGWGAPMWWSHYDRETSLAWLAAAGFVVDWAEEHTTGRETWFWVLARAGAAAPESGESA